MASDYSIYEILRLVEEEAKRELEMVKQLEEEIRRTIEDLHDLMVKSVEEAVPDMVKKRKRVIKVKADNHIEL